MFPVQIDEAFLSFWFKSPFNYPLEPMHALSAVPPYWALWTVVYCRSFCPLRYLASSISFTEQTDVGLLTINLFKKDQHAELGLLLLGGSLKNERGLAVWHHSSKWRHLKKGQQRFYKREWGRIIFLAMSSQHSRTPRKGSDTWSPGFCQTRVCFIGRST